MYALHITEPGNYGCPEVRRVVLVSTKSRRDRLVRFVNEQQAAWADYRKRYPHEMIPSCFCWYPGTVAEPLSMRDARKLIGENEPNLVHDGWSNAYDYIPCTMYKCEVYKCFENDPKVYGIAS